MQPPEDIEDLLRACRGLPCSANNWLITADRLDDYGFCSHAEFLRLRAKPLPTLHEGDSEPARERLVEALKVRAKLWELRASLSASWLQAIGDRGRIGTIVMTCDRFPKIDKIFGLIVREAPRLRMGWLASRLVSSNARFDRLRPDFSDEESIARMVEACGDLAVVVDPAGRVSDRHQSAYYRPWLGTDFDFIHV